VGLFDPRYRISADYSYLANLCRRFNANFLSLPMAIKHEYAGDGTQLNEGHLSTGPTRFAFERDLLHQFEELFEGERSEDPEIVALRERGARRRPGRPRQGTAPRPCATSGKRSVARARRWRPPSGGWSGSRPLRKSRTGFIPDCRRARVLDGSSSRDAPHGSRIARKLGALPRRVSLKTKAPPMGPSCYGDRACSSVRCCRGHGLVAVVSHPISDHSRPGFSIQR